MQTIQETHSFNLTNTYTYKEQTIDFIKEHEGFRENAYICSGGRLSSGYGTSGKLNEKLTQEEAEHRLKTYLDDIVWPKFQNVEATDVQKVALASFDYNTDKGKNLIVNGKVDCEKILLYDKICKTVDGKKQCTKNKGLEKRRISEYNLCKSS